MHLRRTRQLVSAAIILCMLTGCTKTPVSGGQVTIIKTIVDEVATQEAEVIYGSAEAETTGEEETIEQEEKDESISLVMVGDILLHTRVQNSGAMPDGTYNYDHMFAKVKDDIEQADLALVNQEVVLGGRELGLSGYPEFNGAYEVGDSLVNAGFDVVLHATNHTLDKGKEGLLNCINFWETQYPQMGVLGVHKTQEDDNEIFITQINGIKIAILNYTVLMNGNKSIKDMPYAIEMWNNKKITEDVAYAKQNADFVVCCPHWGTEYVLEETSDQKKKAQFLADLGVDLIIGTHPHVIEPVKWIKGANGNDTLVYYSIGNFINATSGDHKGAADRMVGAMAKVTVKKDETGKAFISDYGVEPLVTHMVTGCGNITTYRLSDYTEELAQDNLMKKQDKTFSLPYCKELCKKVFGELYSEQEAVQ